MSLAFLSIGTAVPETVIDQKQALTVARALACPSAEQDTWLPGMYAGTLIEKRNLVFSKELVRDVLEGTHHSGSVFLPKYEATDRGPTTAQRMEHYQELAPPLALHASRVALEGSGRPAEQISHLVTVSCTGFFAPGMDRLLVEHLNLPPTVERTHVGFMGCHGALNGLRVANAFCQAGGHVLLSAVELCSLHYHYSYNPSKMIANAIFADGAASLVGVPNSEAPHAWKVLATGSTYLPGSSRAMTWNIGDHGFEMTLSKHVPELIEKHLRPWLDTWLQSHNLSQERIGSWGIHPGGPKILTAVEKSLGLSEKDTEISREVFAHHGNMSSPTILFILKRMIERNRPRPCLLLGFGPGLVAEAALVG
ncbi:MAG: type III polyketide synthase [Gemmataceae bacterium]